MERVAFLIESTGERIACLLNPESLVVRRTAGVEPHRLKGGTLAGSSAADDRLIFTGGGRTEIDLDLLFDVSLAGSAAPSADVRALTAPLWRLSENFAEVEGRRLPPLVRFVWGKSWNVPGVIAAVAERLEYFTAEGFPRRSWLRMRFLRAAEPPTGIESEPLEPPVAILPDPGQPLTGEVRVHELGGAAESPGRPATSERLFNVAAQYYGHPGMWKHLARYNGVEDPLRLPPGQTLQIPPLTTPQEAT